MSTSVKLQYRPLKSQKTFFLNIQPSINPPSQFNICRIFDFFFLFGLLLVILLLLVHCLYVFINKNQGFIISEVVTTLCSIYKGSWNKDKTVLRFWSIPYAIPPVIKTQQKYKNILHDVTKNHQLIDGELRWFPPFSLETEEYCFFSFDERCVINNSRFHCNMKKPNRPRLCVELNKNGQMNTHSSENCLTLDLAMPPFVGELFPVIVIFTGFRFINNPADLNSVTEPAYLPTDNVVQQSQAIWINARYRLGPLGFFNNIHNMKTNQSLFNLAIKDQIAVLEWVQKNIDRFGGNRQNVILLGHDSGATSALELIRLQSLIPNQTNGWFGAAWLASGSTNWYRLGNTSAPQIHMVERMKQTFPYNCTNKLNENYNQCMTLNRAQLLFYDTRSIVNLFQQFYDYKTISNNILKLKYTNEEPAMMWFVNDDIMNKDGPPNNWDEKMIANLFINNNKQKNSFLKSLVFSSMENEFEGYDGTDRFVGLNKGNEIFSFLQDFETFANVSYIFENLMFQETRRTKQPNTWPARKAIGDIILNVLSTIKYTCPQSWLINKWTKYMNTIKNGVERTQFYHIYNNENPKILFTKVPGPMATNIRRTPFHGLDMLILTGNSFNQSTDFDLYQSNLRNTFYNFVHTGLINKTCQPRVVQSKPYYT